MYLPDVPLNFSPSAGKSQLRQRECAEKVLCLSAQREPVAQSCSSTEPMVSACDRCFLLSKESCQYFCTTCAMEQMRPEVCKKKYSSRRVPCNTAIYTVVATLGATRSGLSDMQ